MSEQYKIPASNRRKLKIIFFMFFDLTLANIFVIILDKYHNKIHSNIYEYGLYFIMVFMVWSSRKNLILIIKSYRRHMRYLIHISAKNIMN